MTEAVEAEAAMCAGAGVGADEQVGSLQERGGLGHREPAGPVAEPGVGLDLTSRPDVVRPADQDHPPAVSRKRPIKVRQ